MIELNFTFFIQLFNFLVLIAVLNWLLVKPAMKIINERRSRVEGSDEETRLLLEQVEKNTAEYQQRLSEARILANSEKEKLRHEGSQQEADIVRKAREEARTMLEEMKSGIERETLAAQDAMRSEIEALSRDIAEKVLGRGV
ncbi:MAG: ATP synthase F0 subunit B [Deltaproteobacteria bacterium]|nr:ATP synthase F0 subunit B [Candidatus Zymogenaceae bacterium]